MDPKLKERFEKFGNCYKILGVPEDARKNEIKKAWRKLSILYHPDKNPG